MMIADHTQAYHELAPLAAVTILQAETGPVFDVGFAYDQLTWRSISQDLGFPRQYNHPTVAAAIDEILAICQQHNVPCGHPTVDTKNVEALLEKGFRYPMPAPVYFYAVLELGRKASGRS